MRIKFSPILAADIPPTRTCVWSMTKRYLQLYWFESSLPTQTKQYPLGKHTQKDSGGRRKLSVGRDQLPLI